MKQTTFLIWMIFTLVLAGCQEKTVTKRSNSNPVISCTGEANYTTPGCAGYCQIYPAHASCVAGTTTGGTTGTIPGCTGNAYYTTPGCAGYCIYYPSYPGCGITTGTTTGGTPNCTSPIAKTCGNYCTTYPGALGCLPNGTNCWVNNSATGCPGSATPLNPQYAKHYPGGEPTGVCQDATAATGGTIETRKATVISSTFYNYNPIEPSTAGFLNTTDILKTVAQAKVFFMTDSVLKLRIKAKPQQDLTGTSSPNYCLGRQRPGVRVAGYTKLKFNVKVYSVDANNGATFQADLGEYKVGVNSCTPAIDLSYWKERSPTGVFVVIENVMSNQGVTCQSSAYNGWTNCDQYRAIRQTDCWGLDLEVAADGTKTF